MNPHITPEFNLTDHSGNRVTLETYRGSHVIVFFGFTHCRVVCPRALERLTTVLDLLGEDAERFRPLYISVDPARDTPEVMRAFLAERAPAFTGLTGSEEEATAARESFRVFAARKDDPEDPDGYAVPHTAITYVLDPEGKFVQHFGDGIPNETVVSRLQALLTGGG